MTDPPTPYPPISVLFITYDRLETLAPTLNSFLAETDYPRELLQLVVADDSSPHEVREQIAAMGFDTLAFATKRGGLGANVNRGMVACHYDLILQLQDDWRCTGPADYLKRAVAVLRSHSDIGMLVLNALPHPDQPVRHEGALRIFANQPDKKLQRVEDGNYSDWPHLKRRAFVEQIGPYAEGVPMWTAELDYSRKVNSQTRWHVADLSGLTVFDHIGEDLSYNWPWKRRLIHVARSVPGGKFLHDLYDRLRHPERSRSTLS